MSWNCRKIGNQHAVDVLSHLVREKAPKISFLMETKQSVSEMKQIQASLPYRCMFVVPSDNISKTEHQTKLHLQSKEEDD